MSTDLDLLIADHEASRLYLTDLGTGEVVVIDGESESVLKRIPIGGGRIVDLALSIDGGTLGVASEQAIGFVDLQTFAHQEVPIPAGVDGRLIALAFHHSGAIFAAANESPIGSSPSTLIYVLDASAGQILHVFGSLVSPHHYYAPLLRTDSDGNVLYVAERGISPPPVYTIDVLDPIAPKLIAASSLNQNLSLRDITVSRTRPELFLACSYPLGLEILDSRTLAIQTVLPTGAFPVAVATSPSERSLFLLPDSPYNNFLYQFSATSKALAAQHELAVGVPGGTGGERGLAVPPPGDKAFLVHGRDPISVEGHEMVQVIDVPLLAPPPAPAVPTVSAGGFLVLVSAISAVAITLLRPRRR